MVKRLDYWPHTSSVRVHIPSEASGAKKTKTKSVGIYAVWLSPSDCGGFTAYPGNAELCPGFPPPQDQDHDSLLVKRRNDNHSPGPVIRELVPSSHQRSELSNTILCIFSG